ncbi:MAG: cyclomaltodextrinase [Lachnospiraceae bacterium]|nr:cyclomaltodextrinase [Lachnospiraceae bacterium]
MWAYETVFYQIYPLGFCGAPFENGPVCNKEEMQVEHKITKVLDWIPHLKELGIGAIYFSPIFESDTHGYNTRDYCLIDRRLGSNEDFKAVCDALHANGIKVVLDGVFNHVGRGFGPFMDVVRNRENSPYTSWFYRIDFGGNSHYNDGLWYEGWEGNYDLVKLNLQNEAVVNHLLSAVEYWIDYFGIDGIRLDVAYSLDENFVCRLRSFCDSKKEEFFLVGEMLHGDYNRLMNDQMLHSATNYECYKGLYSSFNSMNMFEINHSLLRQFGPEHWTLYKGKHLLAFVDNHDVTRVASILSNEKHLPLIYGLLFGMPGIPCVYYGSEWGEKAEKSQGDPALRPAFDMPKETELTGWIAKLSEIKRKSHGLNYGDFTSLQLTNKQCVFSRNSGQERVLVAINADENEFYAHFNVGANQAEDLLTGEVVAIEGGVSMSPYSVRFLRVM